MNRKKKIIAALAVVGVIASPFVWTVFQTESRLGTRYERLCKNLPPLTTELMGFFSIDKNSGECIGTAAKQLGTELDESYAADLLIEAHPADEFHYAAWFKDRKIVLRKLGTPDNQVLSPTEVSALPQAARFLLNIHAFLPKGVRRVVIFSTKRIDSPLEPRCWF